MEEGEEEEGIRRERNRRKSGENGRESQEDRGQPGLDTPSDLGANTTHVKRSDHPVD